MAHPYWGEKAPPNLRKFASGLESFGEAYERALVSKVASETAADDLAAPMDDDDALMQWQDAYRAMAREGEVGEPPSVLVIDGLGPVLPLGKLCLLTGSRDAGKTWVAAVAAAQMILSRYDRWSCDAVVQWFDYEKQLYEFREKLGMLGAEPLPPNCSTEDEAKLKAGEYVTSVIERLEALGKPLSDNEVIERFESEVQDNLRPEHEMSFDYYQPGEPLPAKLLAQYRSSTYLAVFDAYRGLEDTETGSSGDTSGANAERIYKRVIQPFMEEDAACIVTAHLEKTGKTTAGAERLESMSDVVLRVDNVVPFSKRDSGYSKIKVIRDRTGNFSKGQILGYLVMELGQPPRLTATEPGISADGPESNSQPVSGSGGTSGKAGKYEAVDAAILEFCRTPRKTQRDISVPVAGPFPGMNPETVRTRVRALLDDGKLVRIEGMITTKEDDK